MMDVVYILLGGGFFALSWGFVVLASKLMEQGQ